MKLKKYAAPIAAFSAGALLLAACGDGNGNGDPVETDETTTEPIEGEEPEGPVDDTIFYTVGAGNWLGYNGQTRAAYAVMNSVVNERVHSGFITVMPDLSIQSNPEFGDYVVESEDPLVVKYTINEEAVWSDGHPIDYSDALLDWATQTVLEPDWDPSTAGPNGDGLKDDGSAFTEEDRPSIFNVVSTGFLGYVDSAPDGEFGGREITYTYDVPYADWERMVSGFLPAHIVAEQSGMTEEELVQYILDGDIEKIRDMAEFWNEGWANPAPGEFPDADLIPVSGPYTYEEWVDGQYITLVANENYWGTPPATQRLSFRYVDDAAAVSALANGDLDVIEPQPDVDTLASLQRLDGVEVLQGDTSTWEHLDFNVNQGSVFAGNLAAREAFAYCVPRQQIVENLIQPIDPNAVVMNARERFPFDEGYDEYVDAIYDGRYDEVDLDLAREKFEEAGLEDGTDVVFLFIEGNQRRADTASAIKTSCDQVGFNVVIDPTSGADGYSERLNQYPGEDHYDVALFAWAGSGQIASGRNIYSTGSGQNMMGYSNTAVDEAWNTLAASLDEDVHAEQRLIIDRHLWDDLFGLPLYAHPGLVAFEEGLNNVIFNPGQTQAVWNAEEWVR